MVRLSLRLQAVARLVLPGGVAADIGADHGYLSVHLVQSGACPLVVAGEVAAGPWKLVQQEVQAAGLNQLIDVRLGDGLDVLTPGEVQQVILAGMGGYTIRDILARAPRILALLQRLVLQPMKDQALLRRWLVARGWQLMAEDLVLECDHYYQVLMAEQGTGHMLSPLQAEIGPLLIKNRHPQLAGYLQRKLVAWRNVARGRQNAMATEEWPGMDGIAGMIQEAEELLLEIQESGDRSQETGVRSQEKKAITTLL